MGVRSHAVISFRILACDFILIGNGVRVLV
jgi:hypothetical protein